MTKQENDKLKEKFTTELSIEYFLKLIKGGNK